MYSLFLYFDLGCKWRHSMQNEANWVILDRLRNPSITLLSELRLRWFKMLWNTKKNLYNFRVLSFERYWLNQGINQAWRCYTYTVDVLEHSLACKSNMRIDAIYLRKFSNLVHESFSWKHHFSNYIRTLFYFSPLL